jgi:predicted O-linked N-acetylglucosamine transferase (SPINDLY family)
MTITELETIIANGNDPIDRYWQLGLLYLLEGREFDAKSTWFIPIANIDDEGEQSVLIEDLVHFLDRGATQEYQSQNWEATDLISACIREFVPLDYGNLCRSIITAIEMDEFTINLLEEWQVTESFPASNHLGSDLFKSMLVGLLAYPHELTWQVIVTALTRLDRSPQEFIDLIIANTYRIDEPLLAIDLLTQIEPLAEQKLLIWQKLSNLCANEGLYQQSIAAAHQFYQAASDVGIPYQLFANHTILKSLFTAGNWHDATEFIDRHEHLLAEIISLQPQNLEPNINLGLLISNGFLPYIQDRAVYNRQIHNQIADIYLQNCSLSLPEVEPVDLPKPTGTIRVGYLAATLRSHSVGWLSRWLWQYHDRTQFQIFTYAINQNPDDEFHQQWFKDRSDVSYALGINAREIAAQIKADRIDILVDLDSLTLDVSCQVLAFKPAPIQVSWLGWDATGIPTVDYFMADPYVLPDNAQDYYREKIWKMPSTYLGIDGFEVGIPSLTRADLNISDDAIIYWSGQVGYKRHPDTIRLQLEIIKQVPHSYLLIKGKSDRTIIANLFGALAEEVGVSLDRLRFIGEVKDEATHRANLGIADIVLDTFPYSGATTTLETLWMGIPIVTKVGTQFSARNSYTFMKNVGLEEGIAWSDREYINWGIKLGLDPELRAQIRAKLRLSRHTCDLWNGQKFTRQMEAAYQQMWEIFN